MTESKTSQDPFRSHVPDEVLSHLDAARTEVRKGLETFLPEDFFEHRDAARREMLLAGRGMLDAAIRRIDEKTAEK